MNLEELLNKLIQRGWKPFGKEKKELKFVDIGKEMLLGWEEDYYCSKGYSYRELVSIESGLWQFVCENNLIQTKHCWFIDNGERAKNVFYKVDEYDEEGDIIQTGDMEGDKFIGIYEPEYRLIESALCDEDRLEQFLLYNIKVEGNEK